MTPGEIIDTSLRLYQRLGLTFLRHSLTPTLLCVSSLSFVTAFVLPELLESSSTNFDQYVGELVIGLLLAVFVGGPLFLSGMSYTTAMVVSLVSDDLVGNAPSVAAAQEVARKAMPRLLVTTIRELAFSLWGLALASAVLVAGMALARVTEDSDVWAGVIAAIGVLGLFGGFLVFVNAVIRDTAVAPAVVLEGLGAKEAGKRSRQLTGKDAVHGSGTRAGWVGFRLAFFLSFVLDASLGAIVMYSGVTTWVGHVTAGSMIRPLLLQVLELIPDFLTIWLVLPLWATIVTVTYIERRIRLEGFDVEVLARNLARGTQSDRYQL